MSGKEEVDALKAELEISQKLCSDRWEMYCEATDKVAALIAARSETRREVLEEAAKYVDGFKGLGGRFAAAPEIADSLRSRALPTPAPPNYPPTHRCKICGATWWLGQVPNVEGLSWSLRSKTCGPCCDNVTMGEQIEPLSARDPWSDLIAASEQAKRELGEDAPSRDLIVRTQEIMHWSACEHVTAERKLILELRRATAGLLQSAKKYHGMLDEMAEVADAQAALGMTPEQAIAHFREQVEMAAGRM